MPQRILVVDDEIDMLMLMRMIIEDNTGHAVETTNNPSEALRMLREAPIDLVISDLKMPGFDGLELLEEIRQIRDDLPVIIMTAYGSRETAETAVRRGVSDFITKPFKKDRILLTIDRSLELARLKRENRSLKRRLEDADD